MSTTFTNGYALLIGVDQNDTPHLALPDVAKDISAMHKVLADPHSCAYLPDNIHVVRGEDATRDNILKGLTWLKDKLNNDTSGDATAIVYYSGHGHRDTTGNYLIPRDVNISSIRNTAIPAANFAADINDLNPRRLLVLLDCCFAAGIGAKGDLAPFPITPTQIPSSLFVEGGAKGRQALEAALQQEEGAKGMLDALAQGAGRMVISASQADQPSWMRMDGKMSVFTYHLIEALTGYAGSTPGKEGVQVVGVLKAALHVDEQVPVTVQKERDKEQKPDFTFTGQNFPIALVCGGAGAKSTDLRDPVEVVEAAPEPPKPQASTYMSVSNSQKVAQVAGKGNEVSIS